MKKLSKKATNAIAEAEAALCEAVEIAQEYYDERTDKWRESEAGENYSAWLDSLQMAVDTLQELEPQPEAVAS